MIQLSRTDYTHKEFIELVKQLDAELAIRDGDEHEFYDQFNSIQGLQQVVLAYDGEKPVGCGALKPYDKKSMEVKRMFTLPKSRGNGIASKILRELEQWAEQLNYKRCILETGINQPEAIALYHKNGYKLTPNYGQYADAENSRCFEKKL